MAAQAKSRNRCQKGNVRRLKSNTLIVFAAVRDNIYNVPSTSG